MYYSWRPPHRFLTTTRWKFKSIHENTLSIEHYRQSEPKASFTIIVPRATQLQNLSRRDPFRIEFVSMVTGGKHIQNGTSLLVLQGNNLKIRLILRACENLETERRRSSLGKYFIYDNIFLYVRTLFRPTWRSIVQNSFSLEYFRSTISKYHFLVIKEHKTQNQ